MKWELGSSILEGDGRNLTGTLPCLPFSTVCKQLFREPWTAADHPTELAERKNPRRRNGDDPRPPLPPLRHLRLHPPTAGVGAERRRCTGAKVGKWNASIHRKISLNIGLYSLFLPQMRKHKRSAEGTRLLLPHLPHPPLPPHRHHPHQVMRRRRAKPRRRRRKSSSWRRRRRSWRSRSRRRRRSWRKRRRRWRRRQRWSRAQQRNLRPTWRCGKLRRVPWSSGLVGHHTQPHTSLQCISWSHKVTTK